MEGWHSFIHPKWCSHAGTFPSFDKISIIRIMKIVKLVFFLHSICMKALLGETVFSFWSGNHRGFQPHAGEKNANNGYFLWTLLLNSSPARHKRRERTGISTIQMTVFHLLLTIYFTLLHQIFGQRNKKKCCPLCTEKKDQNVLFVEAQKWIL